MGRSEVTPEELLVEPRAQDAGWTTALTDTLVTERQLLSDLIGVLENQRTGVANNDISVVDDSVYAAQRIFLTLRQARLRRQGLLSALMGETEVTLGEMDLALGSGMTASLTEARDGLQAVAQRLARQLDVNRSVIQKVTASGDRLIRAVCGVPERPSVYARESDGSDPSSRPGILLNTKI